jgi:hypothetical protein
VKAFRIQYSEILAAQFTQASKSGHFVRQSQHFA